MCTLPCEQDDTLPKRKSLRPDAGRITTSLSAHASRERLSLAQSCGAVHESPGGGGMPGGHPGGRRGLCADVGGGGSAGDAGDVIGIEANDAIDGGISEDTAGLLDETTSSNICEHQYASRLSITVASRCARACRHMEQASALAAPAAPLDRSAAARSRVRRERERENDLRRMVPSRGTPQVRSVAGRGVV